MKCKFCGSGDVVKAGVHYAGRKRQRWLCKNCGRIFIAGEVSG
jgi:transposase-like protein